MIAHANRNLDLAPPKNISVFAKFGLVALLALSIGQARPSEAQTLDQAQLDRVAAEVSSWLSDPIVVTAVKRQNADHASLRQDEIEALDKQWRAESSAASSPLVDRVLSNGLSNYLREKKEGAAGLYTEIFVMDNKGLNVGQSDPTSDYWQGDEDKFLKTYNVGPNAMHVSDVEFDESSQTFQVQMSMPVNEGGAPIGAVTVGLNAEALR